MPVKAGPSSILKLRALLLACPLIGALLIGAGAHAAEQISSASKYALNRLHDEMSQCYAFYMLTAEGLRKRDPENALIERMETVGDAVMRYMHGIQQMIGMSEEAGLARTRMRTSQQLQAMGGDYVNFAILLERYADFCKQLVDRPKDRAMELRTLEEQRVQMTRQ
jgi:hypothetical protein